MFLSFGSEGANRAALAVKESCRYLPESESFMRNRIFYVVLCAVFMCWIACAATFAQIVPQPMITQRVDNSQLVVLEGNTHPLARSLSDLGAAAPDLQLHRMLLLLNHTPAQEAALTRLLDEQQEKDSPNYHQWLTPQQFGQQFGASMQDIQTITAWLQSYGFQVTQVGRGQNVIEFSGNAGQVQAAFHTAIHSYLGSDGPHWANASDPQIPSALAPAIAGIESLNNFPRVAHNSFAGVYSQSEHKLQSPQPSFTEGCGVDQNNQPLTCFAVSPWDFATIYNVLPLWTAGTDGTGQTIAVVGRSNVNPSDIANFRTLFDLPPTDANHLQVILNGPDPGLTGDESEADIDVQWSGAVAKNAKIDFVVSESTETTDGVDLSAFYIIDNNLAPILSESFGQCEAFLGTAGNAFYNNLWEQAAAQGISVFISTGDNGAAGCDSFQGNVPEPATHGVAVSGLASTPFNAAIGGTDFNDATNAATFWSPTNDPTTQASALGYIPETTWNDSCTNALFSTVGFSTNAETNCNNVQLGNFVLTEGGSGGVSTVYPKPAWQTGTGVPSDGKRDIPDLSLFASNGFVGNFYVICEADITNGLCNLNSLGGFGGTSVSTPAFAGIMALVEQTMGSRQGNPNYVLYKLAATKPTAFHDTPAGSTIAMPCQPGSPNCTVNVAGHTYGVLSGYATGAGYDLATGLGSVDANAMVTNWSSVTFKSSATTLSSLTPTSITHGQSVSATVSVAAVAPATGTPTGDISLITSTGQSVGGFTLASGSVNATTKLLPGGTYTLKAHYEGDGTFGGSDSAASPSITVTPEASKTALQLETFDSNGNQVNPNATTAVYGSFYLLRVNVTNSAGTACAPAPAGQSACPSGTLALTDNSNALDGGTFTLNSLGYTEDQAISLNGGTHSLQAQYAGDVSFDSSTGNDSVTITPATTSVTTFIVPTTGTATSPIPVSVTISAQSFGAVPTGTVTFFSDGVSLGSASGSGTSGSTTGTATYTVSFNATISSVGTHTITATYNGDTNYSSATSQSATIKIALPAPNITIAPNSQTVSAGANATVTAVVDSVIAGPTITGNVTFVDALTAATIPGTVALTPGTDGSGHPTLQASLTFVPGGSQNVQANYAGDANYPATQSASAQIIVSGSDFAISMPPTLLDLRGSSASSSISIEGQNGFNGTIAFSAASCTGLPSESSCSFNPTSVSGTGITHVTVATASPHVRINRQADASHGSQWWALTGGGMLSCVLLLGIPRKRRFGSLLSIMLFAVMIASVSCGGGGSSGGGGGGGGGVTDPGTPTGTYTVTVNATDGTRTHSTTFSLTVQ